MNTIHAHQLHEHHEGEETSFFPALQEVGADVSLVGELDGEHKQMAAALEAASTAMKAGRDYRRRIAPVWS